VFEVMSRELPARPALAPVRVTADFELAGILETTRRIGARHVSIGATPRKSWRRVKRELIELLRARQRGEIDSVVAWTINGEAELREVRRLGIDAVITDECSLGADVCRANV
jgi:hypothetical protein